VINSTASNPNRGARRITRVAAVVVVQAVAAAFFLADAAIDVAEDGLGFHIAIETLIALALIAGVALGAWQTRRMIEQAQRDAISLRLARGAIADVMTARFGEWGLSDAESEVALFALKGFETAEIAELRGVAEGTVRAQLTSVYAKAGVSSRHSLASLFLDELIEVTPAPVEP
jgi:DNA-binding CsgD family transcriptional regulator